MSTRIVISDSDAGHASGVRDAILAGYGAGLTAAEIEVRLESFAASAVYAESAGAVALVRSTTGLTAFVSTAEDVYPSIQCFVPLGSNSSVYFPTPTSVPVIVVSGAGDVDNDTAYGPALEFWDDDNGNPGDLSSYSNGIICGKLLKIKDTLACSWWEARYRARQTATGAGTRTDADGYGQIDVAAAIAFAGAIIDDPYLPVPPVPEPEPEPEPDPKRQAIVTALLGQLAEINGTGSYETTVATIESWRGIPINSEQKPAVIVRDREAVVLEPQGIESPYTLTDWRLRVELELILAQPTEAELRTFIKDVQLALSTDETLDGNAIAMDYVGDRLLQHQASEKIVGALATVDILYRTAKWQTN